MRAVIKAQNYQNRHDMLVIILLLLGLVLPPVFPLLNLGYENLTGSLLTAQAGENLPMFLGAIFILLISRICGWDAVDKTMNYEILAGHSRLEVYFGRVIASVTWGIGAGAMTIAVPVLFITCLKGWGENMSVKDALLRFVLALFPMFRMICELVLLTFLLQSCYAAMLLGWVLFDVVIIVGMVYQELTDKMLTIQTAAFNLMQVFDFSNYRLIYNGGEDVVVYETAVSVPMAAGTILVSLLIGVLCLAAGYIFFRKRDLN